MRAVAATEDGWLAVDLETELAEPCDPPLSGPADVETGLPRVRRAVASGSTVMTLVDARPPLLVSHDAGATWSESGRGLPAGVTLALSESDPDVAVYATDDRLYVTRDGGRFWRRLEPELRGITDVALED